jgi:hypothetical protein
MAKQLKLEPIPQDALPKDLRRFPDIVAMEMYAYRSVSRDPDRIFYTNYEDSRRAEMGKQHVAFRVNDIVLFFATAAGSGVVGNLAYAALVGMINRIRRPSKEIGSGNARLETVVSRQSYNSVRRKYHPDAKASRQREAVVERKLETQYKLIVKLKRD